ncbi:MAG: dephospho-CoA kinase [Planctomycetes bacterium]|nr:dephospho-CoA kinase [Planctomycetota bacterium]
MTGPAAAAKRSIPTIGLVGGIASGKSAVRSILAELGCVTCDADALAHEALADASIVRAIESWWGERAVRHGTVDRSAVAAIVFADPAERNRLESLVHPWIHARRRAMFSVDPGSAVARVIDAPLLLEVGLHTECDSIWFVDAPIQARQARAQAGRGWTAAELARREAAQWPLDQKRALAHHVLRNDGDPQSLRSQVETALADTIRTHDHAKGT